MSMETAAKVSDLEAHKELLTSVQPLVTKVDRNLQVFSPSLRATHFDLPSDFFNLTLEEIKKEQKQRCVKYVQFFNYMRECNKKLLN